MLQPLHGCANSHILPEGEDSVWLCTCCRTSLKKGKIPSFSVVNNIHVTPVPPELCCLNVTEKRLICRVQAFMKLIVLPYGQRALQGQAINFPVNTSELFSFLPRPVDRAGITLIAPPQGSSSDSSEVQRPSQYYAVLGGLMYFELSSGSRHTISCIVMWRLIMIALMSLKLSLISRDLSKN